MVHLSANCQEEDANRYIFSYALKESYHMHGFSEHVLSVDARISSHARVVIDLDSDQEKILFFFFLFSFQPQTEEPLFSDEGCVSIHKKGSHLWYH